MSDRSPICQSHLPHTPWDDPALSRMPGMRPVEGPWIVVDDAYAAQMAERARLMASAPVTSLLPQAGPALEELLALVLADLPGGFERIGEDVIRPDGARISTRGAPFDVLGQLLQEDLLLLDREGEEHVLIAGLLCFPASWTLAEKIGRPLGRIHRPVAEYDAPLATKVQRLFDRVPAGRPMWRANALGYADAALYQPRAEAAPRQAALAPVRYLRSERQTVLRLPETGAILFAVHTWVVPLAGLTPAQRATCPVL